MWSNGGKLKTMLIPEPKKIDALVQSIQLGTVVTIGNLDQWLKMQALIWHVQ